MKQYPSIPTATYRLQFHKEFTFQHARELVPYLNSLGVSHVYASPYFRAAPGSMHGYDICDHNQLNPEVGTREEFDAFSMELRRHGMSQIIDFVPNHMGISESSNNWWMDVLENGPSSPYARYFDVDWQPVKRELENKVLLPILGDQYGRVLERGEFKLSFSSGSFSLHYYERRLPIAPRTSRPLLLQALARLREQGEKPPPELESIITALEYLPERTETDADKVAERAREKEIIKDRLARLCEAVPVVQKAITRVVADVEAGGSPPNFDALDALITAQPYRLAYWRVAAEEINYRRFFDINDLAAIRMELREVFDAAHRLVFELIGSGAATGLRIDHVDGLWHPRAYLVHLQKSVAALLGTSAEERPLYLLVEKILGPGERLRADWPVHGTSGYEFGNEVGGLLVDSGAVADFDDIYSRFLGDKLAYSEIVYRSKLVTMRVSMASEVNVLGHMLERIAETNRWYRDFTRNALTTVIREVIACFPVYRTYLEPAGQQPSDDDTRVIQRAMAAARRRNPAIERTVFEFLREVLLPPAENLHPVDETARQQFVMKFQQCTGPITAKGVEDTSFYVFNRLAALNEVGGEPGVFGNTLESFHRQNAVRLADVPNCMLATSTHDTKRSEDVRARIAALSEMPHEWGRAIRRWHTANRQHRREIDGEMAPDANEEYLLYQTLLGSWPLEPMDEDARGEYIRRIQEYMRKALHEAKVNSSWVEPNEPWDNAVVAYIETILTPQRGNRFLKAFEPLAERVAELGAVNSLAQTLLKLTVPGVPDIYQGNELWDFSLVDPDNRRPVDYRQRRERLAGLEGTSPEELFREWRDGRIKLFITTTLLRFRRDHPELFARGNYTPMRVEGELTECVVAFRREHEGSALIVVAPRLSSRVGSPPIGDHWRDTRLAEELAGDWRELFTGAIFEDATTVSLSDLLGTLPLAVLTKISA